MNTKPDDREGSSGGHKVVATVHPKDGSGHCGIADMVHGRSTGVEGHGNGRNHLGNKYDYDRLPPVETDANHCLFV